ncbi:MAG: helix-turn-helix domain-containing protein, partial [Aggregatilineales bacterium]
GELIFAEDIVADGMAAPHWHDSLEIGVVLQGVVRLEIAKTTYLMQQKQIYVINTLNYHQLCLDEDSKVFTVHFHPALLYESWQETLYHHVKFPFSPENFSEPLLDTDEEINRRIFFALTKIRHEATMKYPAWQTIATGVLIEIAGMLARHTLMKNPALYKRYQHQAKALKRIQPALRLIEEHYADNITLSDISGAIFVSDSYCCVLFQQALDMSPIAYRNYRRIIEACRLLSETDYSIREIAFQVGAGSVQSFNRVFQRERHMTPTQYRLHLLKHA